MRVSGLMKTLIDEFEERIMITEHELNDTIKKANSIRETLDKEKDFVYSLKKFVGEEK